MYAQKFQEGLRQGGVVKDEYRLLSDLIKKDTDFQGRLSGLPLILSKVFHPTSIGHQGIANAISDALDEIIRKNPMPGDYFRGPGIFPQVFRGGKTSELTVPAGCYIIVPNPNEEVVPDIHCG